MRLISCFVCLFLPVVAFADATINVTHSEGSAAVYVKNQKVVFKSNDDLSREAIFVPAESSLYMIDHKNGTFTIINEQKITLLNETVGNAMTAFEQQIKNLTPEQQEKMRQVMGNFGMNMPESEAAKPPTKLVPIGNKNYSGIQCAENTIIQGEETIGKVCLSNGNTLGLSSEDYNTLIQTQRFMFELAQKAGELANRFGNPIPDIDGSSFAGLIVAGENTRKEVSDAFYIVSIEKQANEINTELPTDYVEQKLPMQ